MKTDNYKTLRKMPEGTVIKVDGFRFHWRKTGAYWIAVEWQAGYTYLAPRHIKEYEILYMPPTRKADGAPKAADGEETIIVFYTDGRMAEYGLNALEFAIGDHSVNLIANKSDRKPLYYDPDKPTKDKVYRKSLRACL